MDDENETLDPLASLRDTMAELGFQGNFYKLARRVLRRQHRKSGEVPPIYLVVEGVSRHYGGPQEGGYWYDWSTIETVRRVWGWKEARAMLRELREEYAPPRFDRFSCANRGQPDIYFLVCADPSEFPQEGGDSRWDG